jgi:hypothetical protein
MIKTDKIFVYQAIRGIFAGFLLVGKAEKQSIKINKQLL